MVTLAPVQSPARGLPGLAQVPLPQQAAVTVRLLRDRLCPLGDAQAQLAALGYRIEDDDLGATAGGHQAMLLPHPDGGFLILVDPCMTAAEAARGDDPARVRERRIWHEVAHSLFYSPGAPPRRIVPVVPHEEAFCDALAEELLRLP